MKLLFTLSFLFLSFTSHAQWSNTSNQFYDSLAMPVSTETGDQIHPLVIKSYPDSGYFIIWEDGRNGFYGNTQIFAQKYDKSGNQLWADNGVPVSSGTNKQHYTYSTLNDYRKYSVAATDSAGGLYLCYMDDSTTNYVWQRLMIQHFKPDGSTVFPNAGYILYTSATANAVLAPQLIADGNGGFFVGYMEAGVGTMEIFVDCYKDINGTLKYYGGGPVSQNATQVIKSGVCGNYLDIEHYSTYFFEYKISPDLQKGCNVFMLFSQNGGTGGNGNNRIQMAYNWLWRAKKDVTTPKAFFQKDSVERFYRLRTQAGEVSCLSTDGNTLYVIPTDTLFSNGFMPVTNWLYSAEKINGTTVQTEGNMNVIMLAANERNYINNNVTDFFTRFVYRRQQHFEGIPYEYTVFPYYPSLRYEVDVPGLDKLGSFTGNYTDTLLYDSGAAYYYDFNLASGGSNVFATGLMNEDPDQHVLLQHLKIEKVDPDSFAIQLMTSSKNGIRIGQEAGVVSYFNPMVTADENGNGLFYIQEYQRSTRVSPIGNGAQLLWGAMGKLVGNGKINGEFYSAYNPFVALNPVNGAGVLSWQDDRHPPYVGSNIYMLHLDNLDLAGNTPIKSIKSLTNPYGAITAFPSILLGSSNHWSTFEAFSDYTGSDITTPVIGILDNYNLGRVAVSVFDNPGSIRTYNGQPYLDRDYYIAPQNNPGGGNNISVRLYFTQEQFDALQAADPSITGPEMLHVVKQPAATTNAPLVFTPSANDETITPTSWGAVDGGYYLEINISSFSNFFIEKINGALPVTWVEVNAAWKDRTQAMVSWQVEEQINVQKYQLQHSLDGIHFADVCEVAATNTHVYHCIVPANQNRVHYFRVQQTDQDGRTSLSKVVTLKANGEEIFRLYPNPVHNMLHLGGLDNFKALVIYDVQGKLLMKLKVSNSTMNIKVSGLATGNYILELIGANGNSRYKFVKE